MDYNPVICKIVREAGHAQDRYGDFTSTHEAYGVLAEEVSELLEAIRSNEMFSVEKEARQVAAVALRLAEHVARPMPNPFATRSGCER